MNYQEKIKELLEKLHLKDGEIVAFPDFCVCYTKRKDLKIQWNKGFYDDRYGTSINVLDLNNPNDMQIVNKYRFAWTLFQSNEDFLIPLYDKVMEHIKIYQNKKPLKYKYWNYEGPLETSEEYKRATKYTYRCISNRNLCKIDGMKLNGDVSGLYGILMTDRMTTIDFSTGKERFIVRTCFEVSGTANAW
jgi:hypothetical protein